MDTVYPGNARWFSQRNHDSQGVFPLPDEFIISADAEVICDCDKSSLQPGAGRDFPNCCDVRPQQTSFPKMKRWQPVPS